MNEVVTAIAARHGVSMDRVHSIASGVANHVYLLGDNLVLRIPRSQQLSGDLLKEASVIPAVRRGGVLTPAIVEFDPAVPYMVLERVHGVEAGQIEVPNPRFYEQVGRELAKLHQLPAPAHLPSDGPALDPWARVAGLRAEARLDEESAQWLSGWFDRLAPRVPIAPLRVPIHGDIAPQNLMMAGEALVGIVDWGDAMLADPAVEFAKLPLTVVPSVLQGYHGLNMEPRVLWHHLLWALSRLRDPYLQAAGRHWSAPTASRLLGLLRFFTTTPYWRDLV